MFVNLFDTYKNDLRTQHINNMLNEKRKFLLSNLNHPGSTQIGQSETTYEEDVQVLLSQLTSVVEWVDHIPLPALFLSNLNQALISVLVRSKVSPTPRLAELLPIILKHTNRCRTLEELKDLCTILVNLSFCIDHTEFQKLFLGSPSPFAVWIEAFTILVGDLEDKGKWKPGDSPVWAECCGYISTFFANVCCTTDNKVAQNFVRNGAVGLLASTVYRLSKMPEWEAKPKIMFKMTQTLKILLAGVLSSFKASNSSTQKGLDTIIKLFLDLLKGVLEKSYQSYADTIFQIMEAFGVFVSFDDKLIGHLVDYMAFREAVQMYLGSNKLAEIKLGYKLLGVISYQASLYLGAYMEGYDPKVMNLQLQNSDAHSCSNILWCWGNMLVDETFSSVAQSLLMTPTRDMIPIIGFVGSFAVNSSISIQDQCNFMRTLIYCCLSEYHPTLLRALGHLVKVLEGSKGQLLVTVLQTIRRSNLLPDIVSPPTEAEGISQMEPDDSAASLFVNHEVQQNMHKYLEDIQAQPYQPNNGYLLQQEVQDAIEWIDELLGESN